MQLLAIGSDDKLCVYDLGISLSFRRVQTFERHLSTFVNAERVVSRNGSLEQERTPDLAEV